MALSIFENKENKPDNKALEDTLGDTWVLWTKIIDYLKQVCGEITEEWSFDSPKYGWNLRLIYKKRRIIYLTPQKGYFMSAFVLGDRAVEAAKVSSISNQVKEIISKAKRYGEGTGFRFEVKNDDISEDVKKLIKIKLEN